jgi:surface polysaccharide O-acyltransferase-like enzyme
MFWTAVYLVESIFFVARATVSPFGWAEFVFVLFFGGAKYHLPFFPALAGCLAVIASAPSVGSPRLWGGVAIIAAVARRSLEQGVLQSGVLGPAEMLLFQSMAFASFLPFAMLGARIQAISARGTALGANMDSVGFFLFASVLIATGLRQAAVDSSTATEVLMAGRMAAIVTVLLVALGPGADFAPSSPRLRLLLARLAALSLTVFLVHPLVIDILAPSLLPRAVPSVRVALLLLCVLGISFAFAHVASKVLRTAGWRRSRQFGVSVPLL